MGDEMQGTTLLAQMNELMSEKEKKFKEREQKIEESFRELKNFEAQVLAKGEEVAAQMKLLMDEKRRLEEKEEELKKYEATINEGMEAVLQEKLRIEEQKAQLDKKESSGISEQETTNSAKLNALRRQLNLSEISNTVPELYRSMKQLVLKNYPKWDIIEMLPDRLCIGAGNLEIRVFEDSPISELQIILPAKNGKGKKAVGISRVSPEWSIRTEDNQMICTYQFTKTIKPEAVLAKADEFIKTYL